MVGGKGFEDAHKGRIFLLPPVNEKLAVAELSSERLCCHRKTSSVRLFWPLGFRREMPSSSHAMTGEITAELECSSECSISPPSSIKQWRSRPTPIAGTSAPIWC